MNKMSQLNFIYAAIIFIASNFAGPTVTLYAGPVGNPCVETSSWRTAICAFSKQHLKHPAWGNQHGLLDYLLAKTLAESDAIKFDDDILFAASLLHDVGAFPAFQNPNQPGLDHALLSAQLVEGILAKTGFPMTKLEQVKEAIMFHMYSATGFPKNPETILLHNADTLNLLGAIGIFRVMVRIEKEFPNFQTAVFFLSDIAHHIGERLHAETGSYTRQLGTQRAAESLQILGQLTEETVKRQITLLRSLQVQSRGLLQELLTSDK